MNTRNNRFNRKLGGDCNFKFGDVWSFEVREMRLHNASNSVRDVPVVRIGSCAEFLARKRDARMRNVIL